MTRKKVKMEFIANNNERKNCFKKRKHSLLKKTKEISVLCGIEACAIVYSPFDASPQIWPSKPRAQKVLDRFRSFPEFLQIKNKVNQEIFISQRIAKAKEQMKRLKKENKEDEMTIVMYQYLSDQRVDTDIVRTVADFDVLSPVIEQNLREIDQRLNTMKVNGMAPNLPLMLTQSNQPLIQTQSQQSQMQAQLYQPQMPAPLYQPQMPAQLYQPQMPAQLYQPQMPAQLYQPQMPAQLYQPQMPAQLYQSRIQMSAYQLQLQTSTYQAGMQALVPDEMVMPMLNYGHVSDMNANHMPNEEWMDMLNFNGDETTMIPFGDPNLPL